MFLSVCRKSGISISNIADLGTPLVSRKSLREKKTNQQTKNEQGSGENNGSEKRAYHTCERFLGVPGSPSHMFFITP